MKTSKQVKDWMQSHDWWEAFYANFIGQRTSQYRTLSDLIRYSYNEPIAEAFIWDITPEGQKFWENIDNSFIHYYYDEE